MSLAVYVKLIMSGG